MGRRYDQTMISHVEADRVALKFDGLVNAARVMDVSIDFLAGLTEDPTPADDRRPSGTSGLHRVPVRDSSAKAGWDSGIESAPVIGRLAFRREWMDLHGISADKCSVIEIPDDSMEPTIQSGAWVLVDHKRTRREGNRVLALLVKDKLLVKRVAFSSQGWLLVGDNSKYKALALPSDATVLGRVVWTGRTL